MLNENFVILGAIIVSLGSLSYLIDTLKGKIKPNKVSFFLWALAPLIAFTAEIKQDVGLQSLTTFIVGFNSLVIFLASFINKKAQWKVGKFDFLCGALSLVGLILWYLTKVGDIAIAFSILADGLGSLPTIVKSYNFPETENGWPYLTAFISGILTLLTVKVWNFATLGFPIYLLIVTFILYGLIQFKLGKRLKLL